MKKYIILTVVLLLVLVAGFIVKQNQTTFTSSSTAASTSSPDVTRPISLAEIAKHRSKTDCWTAVEGSVYDMTSFISIHPGGETAITKGCGVDATVLFNSNPLHNASIRSFLTTFKIGILVNK